MPLPVKQVSVPNPRKQRRPVFWRIRADIPKRLYYGMAVLSIALPLLLWAILTYGKFVNPLFVASPSQVLVHAYETLKSGQLISDTLASVSRIALGFLVSAILGVPIGLMIGSFKAIEGLLEPIMGLLRYMPAAAFIPLVILWVGLDEPSKAVIIFLGTFFYNVLMVADSVKFVPMDLIKVSYTLGATERDIFFRVILPATLPNIIDALRVNIATAWNFVIVAELIGANSGLGYRIMMAQRVLRTDEIFLGIILIGLIGLGIDWLFKLVFRWAVPWAIDRT